MDFDLSTYYPFFLFLGAVVLFAVLVLTLTHSRLFKPFKRTPVKQMPYESGMDPIGDARQRFDVKFYLIAILFLVFDVELLFLYPWAVASAGSGDTATALIPSAFRSLVFWEMLVFLGTLAVAYVYAWRKGVFTWR